LSFLEIVYNQEKEEVKQHKEIRIMSCEQICGNHLRLDDMDVRSNLMTLKENHPEKVHIVRSNNFTVIGPNSNDITTTANGKCNWILIKAMKTSRTQINFLILGKVLWGLEISSGLRMKKSSEKHGKEKIAKFLINQLKSIFDDTGKWLEIQSYFR
jgi:hypothetical protein